LLANLAALEFDDDRVSQDIFTLEYERDHSTVADMAIYLDGVFGFNVVQTLVVDIVIRVTRVGGICVELGLKIGRESQTVGVCERLENLNEKNIVLSQNFQCLCIQYR
jgi:hypothetical protein